MIPNSLNSQERENSEEVLCHDNINLGVESTQPSSSIMFSTQKNKQYRLQKGDQKLALNVTQQNSNRFKNGNRLTIYENIKSFKQISPGVHHFFLFLKYVTIFIAILALISLIPIIYNSVEGTAITSPPSYFNIKIATTTIGNHYSGQQNQKTAKIINLCYSSFVLFSLFFFYFYWGKISQEQNDHKIKLPNLNTVVVYFNDLHTSIKIEQMIIYMERYGLIKEIAQIKNQGQQLYLLKQIEKIQNKIEEFKKSEEGEDIKQKRKQISKLTKQIIQLEIKRQKYLSQNDQEFGNTLKFLVTFHHYQDKLAVLAKYKPYQGHCCNTKYPQDLMLNNHQVYIKQCKTQPSGILWQNAHVTVKDVWHYHLLEFVLINLVSFVGLFFIVMMQIAIPPFYYRGIDTSIYTSQNITLANNSTISQLWCVRNQKTLTALSQNYCSSFLRLNSYRIILSFCIGFLVLLMRFVVKQIIIHYPKYLRFKTDVQKSESIMSNLFVNYSTISVLMMLTLQSSIFGQSLREILTSNLNHPQKYLHLQEVQDYQDYTTDWYLDYGYQLAINWIIVALIPHILAPIYYHLKQKIKIYLAQKQYLQGQKQQTMQYDEFEIEDHYASTFMILLVGLLFSSGMPIMVVFTFVALAFRYIYAKYVFVEWSKKTKSFDCYLNQTANKVLIFIIVAYFLNSTWMLGVETIFISSNDIFSDRGISQTSSAHTPSEALLVFFRRLSNNWPLCMIFVVGIVCICIKNNFMKMAARFLSIIKRSSASLEKQIVISNSNDTYCSSSFKIQNNHNYIQLLKKLKKNIQTA